MSEILYRKATEGDAADLSALAISVWVDTYADQGIEADYGRYISDHLTESAFAEVLSSEDHSALLAHCNDRLVGFALAAFGRDVEGLDISCCELEELYIHRNFKGLGIGSSLFDRTYSMVLEAGYFALWLSVYHGNADAIAFYRSMGLLQISDVYFNLNGQQHLNHRFIRVKAEID